MQTQLGREPEVSEDSVCAAAVTDAVKLQKLQPLVEAELLIIRSICSVVDPLSYFLVITAFDSISSLVLKCFLLRD